MSPRVMTRTGSPWHRQAQVTRFAMIPVQHAALAVDAQPDIVLAARGGLGHGERAARAAGKAHVRRGVVDDFAAGHQRRDVGADFD